MRNNPGGNKINSNQVNKELHDIAVVKIAQELFTFPRSEFVPGTFHPTWVTYTNVPEHQMPVEHRWLGEFYPDIVIVDTTRGNMPRVIAEVHTKETLTVEAVWQKWVPDLSECANLYVFVPEGCAREVANLMLEFSVTPNALFTYGFDEDGNLRVTPM